ncbi:hypothetical protein [Psychroserpens sp.]|uniref:hypothetical protein n=1 Tax=Psychroserpens sp. TaxID=2020870 RepID=UPI00385FB1BD
MSALTIFILSFLGINFIVFIPYWLIGLFSKIDQPKTSFFKDSPYFILKKILYQRYTDDCFRLILELQILTLVLLMINIEYVLYIKIIFMILILLSFVYIAYISTIIKVFKKEPMLINDVDFAKTGLMVYKKKIPLAIIALVFCIALVLYISNHLVDVLINSSAEINQKWPLITLLFLSILISFYAVKKVSYNMYHSCVSFSLINHVKLNLKKCSTLKKSLKTLKNDFPYDYVKTIKLKKKPNIIFMFLESYGSFAFSEPEHNREFRQKLDDIYKSLQTNDYHVASTLSESPVSSGGSWLSHSSILFGTKVRDIAAHEVIFSHTDYVSNLESLPKYFETHGYNTAMTTTLSYDQNEVDWQKVTNAYPFEKLMLYNDFNYKGKTVPIFGDRFTIPDEYTLNFAYQSLVDKSPFLLSVSTINSHYNYISPIAPLNHWGDYNSTDFSLTDGLKKNNIKNYFTAINYQIDYIHNFLLNNKLDDTITVLIGDHQPPFITPSAIDKATPIHIITKNNDFVKAFKRFNFSEGLVPSQQTQKHESFFSKFLYALNDAYGVDKNLELPIFEDGIHLY